MKREGVRDVGINNVLASWVRSDAAAACDDPSPGRGWSRVNGGPMPTSIDEAPLDGRAPLLEMKQISKAFGTVRVLNDISLSCWAGEVHALCGENGAGKSTLMKILSGAFQPNGGSILLDGHPVSFNHPLEARRAGIGVIHQELSLLPHRTVAENIFLGQEPNRGGLIDRRRMEREASKFLGRLDSSISPSQITGQLSIAEQQLVEIAKALVTEARILVFDEPTAPLDATESEKLFAVVADLRRHGVAVIYISHRMKEVFALADRITVIKDGYRTASAPAGELAPDDVIRAMVGRPLSEFFPPLGSGAKSDVLLRIEGGANAQLSGIDLTVRAGEIVGVAGLEGSGKGALAKAIYGALPFTKGRIVLPDGGSATSTPRDGARRGIAYLSDDRKTEGLGLRQSLRDNAALVLRGMGAALAAPWSADCSKKRIDALFRNVEVRAAGFDLPANALSGGNQQKVVIARWLAAGARLWVVAEPTRGIDVGAKAKIYRILRDFTEGGGAVLVVSSDLTEIIGLSDRIVVMANGTIAGEMPAGASEEQIMARAVMHGLGRAA
jgi:ribose transport system ATP-binding protein